jgi:DNA/RNA-binding domain of Phe-tRNA-synthetase-like protein
MEFTVSEAWQTAYPGASVGVLAMREVTNPDRNDALDLHKKKLEDMLRSHYAGYDRAAFKAIPTIQAYNAYYKRFKKSYHVQLQLESVVLKGKSIPHVAALVEAMFAAELEDLLLTAGHDLDKLQLPVGVDVADGSERYVRLNGQEQVLKAGDMFIADAQGVISSIIYGPDRRTRITAATQSAIFTAYAPAGIDPHAVRRHLENIESNVVLIAPYAEVELMEVYTGEKG